MNRHTSNPFLSDWDDDSIPIHTQTNAHLFDTSPAQVSQNETVSGGNGPARRSSCSQAEFGSAPASERGNRPSLYRRNMSSFEAASLQLEAHQQQMLENGSHQGLVDAHKDLIAKMTADFQSAIQTNDKQFENLSFNPFDPFETIVDDDGMNSPASTSLTEGKSENKFELGEDGQGVVTGNLDDGGRQFEQAKASHDSIDDDEDELVSTPVRNIKSHADTGSQRPGSGGDDDQAAQAVGKATATSEQVADMAKVEPDSIKKASMFASLLASAESNNQHDASGGAATGSLNQLNEGDDGFSSSYDHGQDVETTAHVIKGSPNSMGDGNDRSVSFFDPFETVIDKDALTSLVCESHNQSTSNNGSDTAHQTLATLRGSELSPGALSQHQRVAESASIETVIENQSAVDETITSKNNADGHFESLLAAESSLASQEPTECQLQDETTTSNADDSAEATALPVGNGGTAQRAITTTTASSASDLHYDSSTALERPQGRRLAPQSGIAPPQPTPSKRATTRPQRRKAPPFQEDSSDSSEEDDRIQIVIKARDINKPDEDGSAAGAPRAIVPLLPPPPSKSSMRQARERGQVEDMPSPIMGYKKRQQRRQSDDSDSGNDNGNHQVATAAVDEANSAKAKPSTKADEDEPETEEGDDEGGGDDDDDDDDDGGQFVIKMTHSDGEGEDGDTYGKCETPLYDEDTTYVLEDFPHKYDGPGWEMMLRYPPKKKLTSNRFWKKIFVKLAQVPLAPLDKTAPKAHDPNSAGQTEPATASTCWALQIFDQQDDKKPMQEIPIQATYTVSEISSQLFDQFGKIFTIKLQYIFYKERVGVRQGQLARFIHTGHIGSSTTSGGHGVDPISIGAIKRMGAPIEHSPQISQIIKLGCCNYEDIKQFKECLEDCLFRMPIHRDRALTSYKTEEVQMAVRDEIYVELNQIGTILKQLARVRLFFLSFLNGMPVVEVGINDHHRQGREVVGRMDILPVVTEEWIRLEAWELHSTVDVAEFENPDSRIVKLTPPDATFFELMRFRVRPPRNRELPLQISANMSVTRTRVSINCEVMVPGCVSRKHGQIPCENIAIRIHIPECWVYFFREEKHFRMGSKKSVNRRPGKVKGIERFLGGGGLQNDFNDESSLIEVTSGQAKYEHHHHAIVWRAARWPKESQSAYVQNTMKIRLPLTAYDKMPEQFYEFVHVEYTMPATTVSHTTLRSISVNPYEEEPPEKYVKYAAKYEYKVKMRLSVNLGARSEGGVGDGAPEASPIVIMKQPDLQDDLQREEDIDDDEDDDDDEDANGSANHRRH